MYICLSFGFENVVLIMWSHHFYVIYSNLKQMYNSYIRAEMEFLGLNVDGSALFSEIEMFTLPELWVVLSIFALRLLCIFVREATT